MLEGLTIRWVVGEQRRLPPGPFGPGAPGDPLGPGAPGDPLDPGAPGDPLGPGAPSDPVRPDGPDGPLCPNKPLIGHVQRAQNATIHSKRHIF